MPRMFIAGIVIPVYSSLPAARYRLSTLAKTTPCAEANCRIFSRLCSLTSSAPKTAFSTRVSTSPGGAGTPFLSLVFPDCSAEVISSFDWSWSRYILFFPPQNSPASVVSLDIIHSLDVDVLQSAANLLEGAGRNLAIIVADHLSKVSHHHQVHSGNAKVPPPPSVIGTWRSASLQMAQDDASCF